MMKYQYTSLLSVVYKFTVAERFLPGNNHAKCFLSLKQLMNLIITYVFKNSVKDVPAQLATFLKQKKMQICEYFWQIATKNLKQCSMKIRNTTIKGTGSHCVVL